MLRPFAVAVFALAAAGSVRTVAQTPGAPHALMHASPMSVVPADSAQCATLHAALREHFAGLPLDSTQMAALHTMLLAHAGVAQLDSTRFASVHATLQQAIASGALDADHIAMFHTIVSDSAHLAAIRTCFAAASGGKAPPVR